LCSFGAFDEDSVNAQFTKVIQTEDQMATSSTIKGLFRSAGLGYDSMIRPFTLRVLDERLRKNSGFQEISELDISIEALSMRGEA
jgi:hypothetical protein